MRLFVAASVPIELREKLREKSAEIAGDGIKLVEPENMHITLRFLGEISDEKEIVQRLKDIKFERFRCAVRGIGAFPSQDYIKVIWAGVESNGKLEDLAAKVSSALEGLPGDGRFSAHVTMARVRKKVDLKKFIEENNDEFGEFEVESFELIKSALSPKGPEYSLIEKFHAEEM